MSLLSICLLGLGIACLIAGILRKNKGFILGATLLLLGGIASHFTLPGMITNKPKSDKGHIAELLANPSSNQSVLLDYLQANADPDDTLVLYRKGFPAIGRLFEQFDAALEEYIATFNSEGGLNNPFALDEATYKKAIASHPDRSTIVILDELNQDVFDWQFGDKKIVLAKANPAWLEDYPKAILAAIHKKKGTGNDWTVTSYP